MPVTLKPFCSWLSTLCSVFDKERLPLNTSIFRAYTSTYICLRIGTFRICIHIHICIRIRTFENTLNKKNKLLILIRELSYLYRSVFVLTDFSINIPKSALPDATAIGPQITKLYNISTIFLEKWINSYDIYKKCSIKS